MIQLGLEMLFAMRIHGSGEKTGRSPERPAVLSHFIEEKCAV
jgi:hypothetical protein